MTGIEQFDVALPHGITLACRAAGQPGRPVLVFLHGFPQAAFVWDAMLLHWSEPKHGGYRCIAPNLRGYAGSSAPADVQAYRPRHLVQDISALVRALGGPGVAALVAHDWGGAIAWNLAAQEPALLQRLVILNAPHPVLFARELARSPAQQAASAYMNFLARPDAAQKLAEDDFRRLWALLRGMGTDQDRSWLDAALQAQHKACWQGGGLTGPCAYYAATPLRPPAESQRPDERPALAPTLGRIEVPTLVIWGLRDQALLPGLLEGLQEYVPRLQVHGVPDASHWIVHERSALVIEQITGFLQRQPL
jgi:pimeloyl-ACP methyl ester carboxylesterase